jgi:hypothetical protein
MTVLREAAQTLRSIRQHASHCQVGSIQAFMLELGFLLLLAVGRLLWKDI